MEVGDGGDGEPSNAVLTPAGESEDPEEAAVDVVINIAEEELMIACLRAAYCQPWFRTENSQRRREQTELA